MKELYRGFCICGTTKKTYLTISAAEEAAGRMLRRKVGARQARAFSTFAREESTGKLVKED